MEGESIYLPISTPSIIISLADGQELHVILISSVGFINKCHIKEESLWRRFIFFLRRALKR